MATALALLDEAVERFADDDLADVRGAELHDMIRRLHQARVRLEAQLVRVVARWDATMAWADNGSKAPGARLARDTHLPKPDAKRLVRRSRALSTMPVTEIAYRAGEINGAHVDMLATCDRAWHNASFTTAEGALVDTCRNAQFAEAAEQIRIWQLVADRDTSFPDPDKAARDADRNRLSASTSFQGRVFIDGNLDALSGEIVTTELDRLTEQIRLADRRDGTERSPSQRRAAALVEMATRSATAPADGQRPKPLLTVTMGAGHFAWMCHTAAGTIIEPELFIPYLADADIERIIHDPPNRKLEASQQTPFTGALRKIIGLRDRHCQHPCGCDEPAQRCDVDHIEPRFRDGITCYCNGQLLCTYHNRIVKAEHDRRLAMQHRAERDAQTHHTNCLLAQPQPAQHLTDTDTDHGNRHRQTPTIYADDEAAALDWIRARAAAATLPGERPGPGSGPPVE